MNEATNVLQACNSCGQIDPGCEENDLGYCQECFAEVAIAVATWLPDALVSVINRAKK